MYMNARSNLVRGIAPSGSKIKIIFQWLTPAGSLGEFYSSEEILIAFEVESTLAIDHFELAGGDFPPYLSLLSDGKIYGVVPDDLEESLEYHFTVAAINIEEDRIEQEFSLTIKQLVSQVEWVTPEGSLGSTGYGQPVYNRVEAESEVQ